MLGHGLLCCAKGGDVLIIWHERDLRIEDHLALTYAAGCGLPVCPLYIYSEEGKSSWPMGSRSRWWLHHSLLALQEGYRSLGADLYLQKGDPEDVFRQLTAAFLIKEVCWIERFTPDERQRDRQVQSWLEDQGVKVSIFPGNYLIQPDKMLSGSQRPYQVFTPFAKAAFSEVHVENPLPAPKGLKAPLEMVSTLTVEDLRLLPGSKSIEGQLWKPGRTGALEKLEQFSRSHLDTYARSRDLLAEAGTSSLSAHLSFGEISPREVWWRCFKRPHAEPFLRQLIWREFASYFLYHFPKATDISWKEEFEAFPWSENAEHFARWKQGQTGFPVVDAAMRQLLQTGWMHNRARMVVGSFLVKDLLLPWQWGARWFWEKLVDADLPNNTLGWQWIAGCGPDAAVYFRIFNPTLQGEKFDPQGDYIRRYVPELKELPKRWIHKPHEAPQEVLQAAGITLGKTYPQPIVDHAQQRKLALAGYEKVKSAKK